MLHFQLHTTNHFVSVYQQTFITAHLLHRGFWLCYNNWTLKWSLVLQNTMMYIAITQRKHLGVLTAQPWKIMCGHLHQGCAWMVQSFPWNCPPSTYEFKVACYFIVALPMPWHVVQQSNIQFPVFTVNLPKRQVLQTGSQPFYRKVWHYNDAMHLTEIHLKAIFSNNQHFALYVRCIPSHHLCQLNMPLVTYRTLEYHSAIKIGEWALAQITLDNTVLVSLLLPDRQTTSVVQLS